MYPGNHIESEMLNVPRNLKTRPDADETHLAYITDDEADLLEIYKPGTPHRGAEGIPNYDGGDLLDYTPSFQLPSGGGSFSGYVGPTQSSINEAQQQQEQVQQNYVNMYGANEQGQPDMYIPPEEYYTDPIPEDIIYDDKIADYSFSTPDVRSSVMDKIAFRERIAEGGGSGWAQKTNSEMLAESY